MSLSLGIVGLPNVGKSTLFNALTRSKQANVANYPFCTIEPNVGVVEVPDRRLRDLAEVSVSKKVIPTVIEFVDIAGLVKGAAEGAGLGNKFLSHIREVDAILQVVRAFEDGDITHVANRVDPADDVAVINMELALADLEIASKRLDNLKKSAKGAGAKDTALHIAVLARVVAALGEGKTARSLAYTDEERTLLKELQLLTMKPMMYVVNSDELGSMNQELGGIVSGDTSTIIRVCAKLEAELAELSPEDAEEYMRELGMGESGLDKIISSGYRLLSLITYFTSGEPETRGWTVERGAKAPEAAGVIHTDFVRGFIRADVCGWEDFVSSRGWAGVRTEGKLRIEGKEYVVQDGDVVYFHVV